MQNVIDMIKSNQCTLFLGAGSSKNLGGPSGIQLLESIKNNFSDVKVDTNNFFDACKLIAESDNHSLLELNEFITKQLNGLYPNQDHIKLLSLPWRCIFTTNYDTVVEKIPPRDFKNRSIRVVKEKVPSVDFRRKDILYYVKLFGSIDSKGKDDGRPIITRQQYNTSIQRNAYYKLLEDCLMYGPIIFIGYSFQDDLIFDMMAELQETMGYDIKRPSYAIMPHKPNDKTLKSFHRYKINYVEGTLSSFAERVSKEIIDKRVIPDYIDATIYIHGIPIDIPSSISQPSEEYIKFINSSSLKSPNKEPKNFFNGEDTSLYPYEQQWDFIRELYSFSKDITPEKCIDYGRKVKDGFKNYVFRLHDDPLSEHNEFIILTGQAGCGKTTILNRLSFDWYSSGLPVIFMNPQGANIDNRQITTFIQFIQKRFMEKQYSDNKLPLPRVLIICDNGSSFNRNYIELFHYLTSRGIPIVMVLSDRENKLKKSLKDAFTTYSMPEFISKDEVDRFKNYLEELKLIDTDAEFDHFINDRTINNSFFALMYYLVDESKRPLSKIIKDQYNSLSDWPKSVYEYVCLFNKYGIEINEKWLIRATVKTYVPFRNELNDGQLKKVIFTDLSELDEDLDYRVHHPIIAEKTVDIEFLDPSLRVGKFLEIFDYINPYSMHEVDKAENFLVYKIGPNSPDKEIPVDLKKDIFKLVSSKIHSRPIYHHYALLELSDEINNNEKDFDNAKSLLQKALEKKDGREPDEMIYTSFGKYYSILGYYLEREKNDTPSSIKAFEAAEKNFERGRNKGFLNAYSYDGQVILYKRRAEYAKNDLDKIVYLSKAMNLCNEAINNTNKSEHERFLSQEMKISHIIKDMRTFDDLIIKLADEYNSSLGYRLKANILYTDYYKGHRENIELLEEADITVDNGLLIEENEPNLLRLKSLINIELNPDKMDLLYNLFKNWYAHSDANDLKMLFYYGIILFDKGLFVKSKNIFDDLNYNSQGNENRSTFTLTSRMTDHVMNKTYTGKVIDMDAIGKKGLITCTELHNLKYPIPFSSSRTQFSPKMDDYVKFKIYFNYRGPYCYDVVKN